jgi:O-antigen ligase
LTFGVVGVLSAPISAFAALSLFKASSIVVAVMLSVMATAPLIKTRSPTLLFNAVYIYFSLIAFLAMIGGILHPNVTRMVSTGVFGFMLKGWPALNPNSLSYVGAVVLVVSLHRLFAEKHLRRKLLYIGVGATGAVALILSQGRTSLASAFIAIVLMAYFIKEMRPFRYVILAFSVLMLLLFIVTGSAGGWFEGVGEYLRRGADDQQLETLSGRTEAWAESWNLFLASPLLGYGFYATGKVLLAPHNAYFAVLLNVGLLGFLPWVLGVLGGFWAIFARFLRRSWRTYSVQNSCYMELVAVMIVQFFRTITSQDITIHSYSMLIFMSVLIYVYARERIECEPVVAGAASGDEGTLTSERGVNAVPQSRILRPRRTGKPLGVDGGSRRN